MTQLIRNQIVKVISSYSFIYFYSVEILYKIKEEHCFCALPNFEAAYQRKDKIEGLNVNVSVGNLGQQVSLNSQRFIAPEILFKPSLLGRDMNGGIKRFCSQETTK